MGKRRVVLEVEYDDRNEPHDPRPAEWWEQVIAKGQRLTNVRVEVRDDR